MSFATTKSLSKNIAVFSKPRKLADVIVGASPLTKVSVSITSCAQLESDSNEIHIAHTSDEIAVARSEEHT